MESVTIQDRTYQFSVAIITTFRLLQYSEEDKLYRHQLLRSATSIGANVVEAQYAASRKQFLQYMQVALRSSNETTYWLRLMMQTAKAHQQGIEDLLERNQVISKILAAILITGKRNLQ